MMVIDCISDTHGQHKKLMLPGGDILIHAGDFSEPETELEDVLAFLDWFQGQKYSYRLLVAGNHDGFFALLPELMEEECTKRQIIYLSDSGCVIKETRFWGSPIQPGLSDWAFSRSRGADIKKHWDLIPKKTEILITHGPPYKIRDEICLNKHVGCEDLFSKIQQTQIKLHVFGHIHAGAGHMFLNGCLYINAASPDGLGYKRVIKQERSYRLERSQL